MALPGVKYIPDIDSILKVIEVKKGIVTQIYKQIGISHTKFYELVDEYPELKVALDKARNDFECTLLDAAENSLLYALEQREDVGSSIRSAQYVLNNKGRKRGYTPPTVTNPLDQASEKSLIEKIVDGIDRLHPEQQSEQHTDPCDSQTTCQHPQADVDTQ